MMCWVLCLAGTCALRAEPPAVSKARHRNTDRHDKCTKFPSYFFGRRTVSFAYSYVSMFQKCCAIMEVCRRKGSTGTPACAVVSTGKNAASAMLATAAKPDNRRTQSFERLSVTQLDSSHVSCSGPRTHIVLWVARPAVLRQTSPCATSGH